jgi:hypothetical protein
MDNPHPHNKILSGCESSDVFPSCQTQKLQSLSAQSNMAE